MGAGASVFGPASSALASSFGASAAGVASADVSEASQNKFQYFRQSKKEQKKPAEPRNNHAKKVGLLVGAGASGFVSVAPAVAVVVVAGTGSAGFAASVLFSVVSAGFAAWVLESVFFLKRFFRLALTLSIAPNAAAN